MTKIRNISPNQKTQSGKAQQALSEKQRRHMEAHTLPTWRFYVLKPRFALSLLSITFQKVEQIKYKITTLTVCNLSFAYHKKYNDEQQTPRTQP